MFLKSALVVGAAALAFVGTDLARAEACGCFAPPDPSVPIVQAGERILFAVEDGQVTAHIQIQYAGPPSDFGWILPLPSVPTLQVGTDDLFTQLLATTQPKYVLTRKFDDACGVRGNVGGTSATTPEADGAGPPSDGLVVVQSSVGPYDYAVLRAESKAEMLKWMADNHYFVPAGTDTVVAPYIHTGAYFLALKLKSGETAGSLQPVVVKYASDLPMIPLVLTSVAAQSDMGIQVWLLGAARAIPRNYYHTVLNDALLDWSNGAQNYNAVIVNATKEADGRHTFVTEYAGASTVMANTVAPIDRFGSLAELATQSEAIDFLAYLASHGYATAGTGGSGGPIRLQSYSPVLLALLQKYIPVPSKIVGLQPNDFYFNAGYYLGSYRALHPSEFEGYVMDYRPDAMAAEIGERIVRPARDAQTLVDGQPYLTRLYTTLSPEEMNRDPVFSFNRTLPDVANVHRATLDVHCSLFGTADPSKAPATLTLESGLRIEYPHGYSGTEALPELPYSLRIEVLSEEGPPQPVIDNGELIGNRLDTGCSIAVGGRSPKGAAGSILLLGLLLLHRRRRPS